MSDDWGVRASLWGELAYGVRIWERGFDGCWTFGFKIEFSYISVDGSEKDSESCYGVAKTGK